MDEQYAITWITDRFGEAILERLRAYVVLLGSKVGQQNLIAASTLENIWSRHIVDSLQLLRFVDGPQVWVDIGSGAGLPALPIAIASEHQVVMVEPRRLRAEFLRSCVAAFRVQDKATVIKSRVETAFLPLRPTVISARAVAPLGKLLSSAHHLSTKHTIWCLPKGQSANSEVTAARQMWQGSFHVEPSIVDPSSGIVIARGVRPR